MRPVLLWFAYLSLAISTVYGQIHHRCPLSCRCDFDHGFKKVHCEPSNSGIDINLNDVETDVQFLEIIPDRRGTGRDVFGPVLPDVFQDFTQLERLIVRNNGIQSVPANTARQLTNLKTLDLSGNEIASLRDLSLDQISGLDSLQLSSNIIQNIDATSLQAVRVLRVLGLSGNRIQSVSGGAFHSSQGIAYLDLAGNQLTSVPSELQQLRGLRNLLLDDNQITTISGQMVQVWRSSEPLIAVSLSHNPFQCDSSLSEFISWVKSLDGFKKVCDTTQQSGPRGQCPLCTGPSPAAGQTVNSVDVQNTGSGGRITSGSDQDFITFGVIDPISGNSGPRRAVQGPDVSSSANDLATKLRQSMPDAGVQCGSTKCYYFSAQGTRNWQTALATCHDVGLDLVEIQSSAEQRELMSLLIASVQENSERSSPSRGWWIGYRYDPQTGQLLSASTARSTSYSNWARGRPATTGPGQECVEMFDTGDWSDGQCTLQMADQFICQSDLTTGRQLSRSTSQFLSTNSGNNRRSTSGSSFPRRSSSGSPDTVSFTIIQ